jgi:hypothetical protein
MPTPDRDRATDRFSNPDSTSAERSGAGSAPAPIAVPPRASVASGPDKTAWRRGRRARRPERLPSRVRSRPQVGLLEQRALLSSLPTLTALIASTASAVIGQSVTFTATVSDLSPGGATPSGGTVTFSDQSGAIDSATLINGVAAFTTSSLPSGTITVTASYSGTADFAPSATGTIVTAAGNGTAGFTGDNGPATDAELNHPWGLAVDSAGDLFITDGVVLEVVKATGDIITVAGNGTAGYSGDNGPATAAELNGPNSVAVDSAGDLFISDQNNNRIREVVKATGDIITVAGNGTAGYSGDNGPATDAELDSPRGIAVDSAGDVFFEDGFNNVTREVVKATGDIITVAELTDYGVAVDSAGDLFVDGAGNTVQEVVKSTGDIITVAGNGTAGYSGDNGPATSAELNGPSGLAVDSAGDLFITDQNNNVIREVVKSTGDIITVAGDGIAGYSGDNGPATAAELDFPGRVAIDSAGDLFVVDSDNNVVREVTPAVTVTIGPGVPIGGTAPTRTVLTAQPRPANLGRPVTLTATVKDLKHRGPTPIGSVTFLDGTVSLGSVALRHGKASLKTSSLPLGPNTIQAYYIPGQGFAPSTAAVVENVRAHRSRSKAAPSAETGRSPSRWTSLFSVNTAQVVRPSSVLRTRSSSLVSMRDRNENAHSPV